MSITNRLHWAVGLLRIKPTDHILEIGCGAGKAIASITPFLSSGTVTGVDQSAAMITRAAKNNQVSIEDGRVVLLQQAFSAFKESSTLYNTVFAFDVNIFWKDPSAELKIIKDVLAPGGKLYLFHLPPVNKTKAIADTTIMHLKENRYGVLDCMITNWKPIPAFCIIAEPS